MSSKNFSKYFKNNFCDAFPQDFFLLINKESYFCASHAATEKKRLFFILKNVQFSKIKNKPFRGFIKANNPPIQSLM
jgi:hypothetical protein